MAIRIISADERMREKRGAKILLLGRYGVGKTYCLRSLEPSGTRFIDAEAGDLSVLDYPVPTLRVDDWPTARDIICKLVGPNPSFPPTMCYSQAHFDAVGRGFEDREQIHTVFVDSLTFFTTLAFRWCEQQPEAFSAGGKKDLRSTYGLLGREVLLWANHLQHARDLNVIFVGALEWSIDDLRVGSWQLIAEGQRIGRELPGIVDQIVTLDFLDFGDGKPPERGFVCRIPNPWNFPAKDRSGRLELIEPPDLGRLLAKLVAKKNV